MIKRFQIEDIIEQDSAGVTFRAVDTVTDAVVAVRRFFPFGVDGRGLESEEEAAYIVSVDRMARVRHPQLRAVIAGGCDPIDSIPFIATEWIEGDLLSDIVNAGPLCADDVAAMASKALEVCELLSQVLAEEAIWVETELHTIVVANPPGSRGATFWISPLKWLGGSQARGYDAIIEMVEEAMGWKGQSVGDQAGRGLGAWLNWLRAVPAATPLREVRETLAAAIGVDPPVAVAETSGAGLVSKAPTPRAVTRRMSPPVGHLPRVKTRRKLSWLLLLALASVLAGGAAVWWLNRGGFADSSGAPAMLTTDLNKAQRVIPWDQRDALVGCNKLTVTIIGPVSKTAKSDSGKTLYLLFSDDPGSARIGMLPSLAQRFAAEKRFESWVGRKVLATGTVRFNATIGKRPEIIIESLDDLKSAD